MSDEGAFTKALLQELQHFESNDDRQDFFALGANWTWNYIMEALKKREGGGCFECGGPCMTLEEMEELSK